MENIYGLPKLKKFPLDTEDQVIIATKYYKYADKSNQGELADNIIQRAVDLGVSYKRFLDKDLIKLYINKDKKE